MKNAKITIAASVATAYTEAARDIANKRRATKKLSPKIYHCRLHCMYNNDNNTQTISNAP